MYHRTGLYPIPLPLTLGQEAAGTVVEVGEGVSTVKAGDRVAWSGIFGSYAQLNAVPAHRLVQLPPRITTRVAAAAMLQGMTAHYLATSTYPLKPGDTCLVHAGAGGVGLLLTQVAKMRGARVIATVSTEEKAALSRQAGADEVVMYTQQDFEVEVKRLTEGRGVQVVYDSVGQTTFAKSLNSLAPRGLMALYGQSSGAVAPVDPLMLSQKGSLFLTRPDPRHLCRRASRARATRERALFVDPDRRAPPAHGVRLPARGRRRRSPGARSAADDRQVLLIP